MASSLAFRFFDGRITWSDGMNPFQRRGIFWEPLMPAGLAQKDDENGMMEAACPQVV
jgi:hypothetical protein